MREQNNEILTAKIDLEKIRSDFPILKRIVNGNPIIYFDNAATTQRPQQVIDAVKNFYEKMNANIHRAVHTLSYEATIAYEEAHKKVAKFINAKSWREIIFTRNATEAVNLVAYAWGLQNLNEDDEIVITIMEHHSNIVPWQFLKKIKGVKLKFVDITDEGYLKVEEFEKLITEKTKLVGVVHASNVLGTINPVKEITQIAKSRGCYVLIDGAQSTPHIKVDVQDIGCDFFVASGHKMLGPTGIGFLYARREILEEMNPFLYGGDMISTVTTEGATWNELPWKFEAGTPNVAGGIGLGAAVDYLQNIGMDKVFEHEKELLNYAFEKMREIPDIEIYGPRKDRLGVISFNIKGIHPHDVAGVLDQNGIAVRSGNHCTQPLLARLGVENTVRASFYIYNTFDEIDKFVEALKKAVKIFKR
jgi:cysteine desulfurase / selenocysteine lyase